MKKKIQTFVLYSLKEDKCISYTQFMHSFSVRVDNRDVRNLSKTDVEAILNSRAENQDMSFDILRPRTRADRELLNPNAKLPEILPENIFGYCHLCPKCQNYSKIANFTRHMRFGKHEERERNFICPQCHKNFERAKNYNEHACVRVSPDEIDRATVKVKYKYRKANSFIHKHFSNVTPLELYRLCITELFCFIGLFPYLYIPHNKRRLPQYSGLYQQYGVVANGAKMLIRALKQHFEETGSQDGLLLHRNIDVHSGDGSLLIKLREDVTCPNHHNILVTKVCTRYYKYVYSFREYIMHFFLITNLI